MKKDTLQTTKTIVESVKHMNIQYEGEKLKLNFFLNGAKYREEEWKPNQNDLYHFGNFV